MVRADIAIDDRPELYSEDVRTINPKVRRANQRYNWHKIAEDLIEEYSVKPRQSGKAFYVFGEKL